MAHKCDGLARVFDFVFVGGFATLAVLYILLRMIPGKDTSTGDFVLVGYYIFFALFMTAVVLRNETLMMNCGFLDHLLLKSVFYVL